MEKQRTNWEIICNACVNHRNVITNIQNSIINHQEKKTNSQKEKWTKDMKTVHKNIVYRSMKIFHLTNNYYN